jgi:multiple sugar transport system permease protein
MAARAETLDAPAGRGPRLPRVNPARVLMFLACCVITVFFLYPIFWWLLASIKPFGAIFHDPLVYFGFTPTDKWYSTVLLGTSYEQNEIQSSGAITGSGGGTYYSIPFLVNSLVTAVGSTIIVTLLSATAGYGLSRFAMRGRKHITFWVLSTRMMPPVSIAVPLYLMYRDLGLLDTRLGLVLVYVVMNLPIGILLMKSFFDDIPRDFDEAAMVDGATRFQAFRLVTFHYVRPGLAATAILAFIFAWNEFLFALVLTGDNARTMPVAASTFVTSYGTEWGYLSALGTAAMVPTFIFILLVQRHLVRGLTLGGVRG